MNCTFPSTRAQPHARSPKVPRAAALAALLSMAADLSTKWAAAAFGRPHTGRDVGAFALIRPVTNPALSLGVAHPETRITIVLMALALAAAATTAAVWPARSRPSPWAIGLTLGGAGANTFDRSLHGAVQDFIVTGPVVINLADVAVFTGLILLCKGTIRRQTSFTRPEPHREHGQRR